MFILHQFFTIILITVTTSALGANAQTLLDNGNLQGWRAKVFDGETQYLASNGVLQAIANDSASGYFYKHTLPVNANTTLSWRWKVEQFPKAADELSKAGDDFAARLYVLKKGLFGLASARAIAYVWSDQYPPGISWANPYTGKTIQVVVNQSGDGWQQVQRHIQADFKRYHGMDITEIDAVAIMTDSDQSGSTAIAYYDHIRLE